MAQAKYLQVKEDILKKIQIGKLCPMDMLPSENALCQEYSMSRMSIRKALNILLSEGYISSVPGKGYFVNRPTIDQYILRCDSNQFTEVTMDQIRLKTSTIVRPDDDIRLRLKLHENWSIFTTQTRKSRPGRRNICPIVKGVLSSKKSLDTRPTPTRRMKNVIPLPLKKVLN